MQPKITTSYQAFGTTIVPLTKARSAAITQSVREFIIDGLYPISIADKQAFWKMFNVIEPRYQVPSIRTVKANVLDRREKEMTAAIILDIEGLEYVILMHDSWKSMANRCYETVTVHYINRQWQLQWKVLFTQLVEVSHTSEAIQKALLQVKANWRLQDVFAVTDNAANEVKPFSLLQLLRAHCLRSQES